MAQLQQMTEKLGPPAMAPMVNAAQEQYMQSEGEASPEQVEEAPVEE